MKPRSAEQEIFTSKDIDFEGAVRTARRAVGSAYDNAMVESFWGRMQAELFNRQRWKTRIELATAIHDYIELLHGAVTRRSECSPRPNTRICTTQPNRPQRAA